MLKSDFYYNLPEELIAQEPIEPRDASRLLVMDKQTGALTDGTFRTDGDTYAYEAGSDLIYHLMDQSLPSLTLQIGENAGYITDISYTRELPENKYFMWADSDGLLAIQLAFKARAWAEAGLKEAFASEEALANFLTDIQNLRDFGSDIPLPGGSAETVILGYRLTYTVEPQGELIYNETSRYSTYESYIITFRMERLPREL